ncbi:hypothetical protein SRABI106_04594 [Rahnella aquatilis]|nr:hypothetical protein SRABI106_04594 [Rahnella aquatilis]
MKTAKNFMIPFTPAVFFFQQGERGKNRSYQACDGMDIHLQLSITKLAKIIFFPSGIINKNRVFF